MTGSPELSKHVTSATTRSRRSSSYGSSSDDSNSSIPEMIVSTFLQSFPESNTYWLSSSIPSLNCAESPVLSPRSIFGGYWLLPTWGNPNIGQKNGACGVGSSGDGLSTIWGRQYGILQEWEGSYCHAGPLQASSICTMIHGQKIWQISVGRYTSYLIYWQYINV